MELRVDTSLGEVSRKFQGVGRGLRIPVKNLVGADELGDELPSAIGGHAQVSGREVDEVSWLQGHSFTVDFVLVASSAIGVVSLDHPTYR